MEDHCYCGSQREQYMIHCSTCKKYFHSGCLRKGAQTPLIGDTFFHFVCANCSEDGEETITRLKLQWMQVIMLTLYNLQLQGGGKCGYYRWKENICTFIEKHWTTFFGCTKKKTSTWRGTVAGTLSNGCPQYFRSGTQELKESGWWALADSKLPEMCNAETIQERNVKAKQTVKNASDFLQKRTTGLRSRSNKPSIQAAIELKERRSSAIDNKELRKHSVGMERKGISGLATPSSSSNYHLEAVVSDLSTTSNITEDSRDPTETDSSNADWSACEESIGSWYTEKDLKPDENLPQLLLKDDTNDSDDLEIDPGSMSPSISIGSPKVDDFMTALERMFEMEKNAANVEERLSPTNSESEAENVQNYDLEDYAHQQKKRRLNNQETEKKETETNIKHVPLTLYEEKCLLERLQQMEHAVDQCLEARILRRQLLLRQAKRERNLPVFDLDANFYKRKDCQEKSSSKLQNGEHFPNDKVSLPSREYRILDRYYKKQFKQNSQHQQQPSFLTRLIGRDDCQLDSIVSPYTARVLKPFIWRDYETIPPKLKLLQEIEAHYHRNNPTWTAQPHHPIDYCYVQLKHIPTVNALCQEFFWPGINLSECLQYPDFSCIAMYRKMIVGFSFMVPDVKYNEAYITFIFTHPEWRKAGIATFMLYHLIQTCMGKDVTLHVSCTNPAIFLYQKFGFKVEEFIIDFYDKYFPVDSKECKHSFFFRLSH